MKVLSQSRWLAILGGAVIGGLAGVALATFLSSGATGLLATIGLR